MAVRWWRRVSTDVLLTRPAGDNDSLARKLTAAGLVCEEVPLLAIEPVDLSTSRDLISDLDRFDHIIFVSRNAVRHGLPALEDFWPQWPAHLNWYAVGEATADELRAGGLDPRVPDRENSEGLLDLPPLREVDGAQVLIVRGVDGREVLKAGLEARGARTTYLEVHERRAATLPDALKRRLVSSPPPFIIVYSGSVLDSFVNNIGVVTSTLVVPSARVENESRAAGFQSVITAASASEPDMVQAILSGRS